MDRSDIFRNSKKYYLNARNTVSDDLIDFALKNSGKDVLDIGCATGEYCLELKKHGLKCTGIDINQSYVTMANKNNVEAYQMDAGDLKFKDNSFDTVLLFEVLEHVTTPEAVLKEAKRVARNNILLTVPNCTGFNELVSHALTFEHMLDETHVNFFTKKSLEGLLSEIFNDFKVEEREPLLLVYNRFLQSSIRGLYRLGIFKPSVYGRLYGNIKI